MSAVSWGGSEKLHRSWSPYDYTKVQKKKIYLLKVYLENLHFQKLPFLIQTNYIQVIAKISSFRSYKNLYLKVII